MVSPLSITLIHGGHWFTEGHPVSLVETTARIAAKTTRPADPLIEADACRVTPQPATTNTPPTPTTNSTPRDEGAGVKHENTAAIGRRMA